MTAASSAVGRAPEDLSLTERFQLAGQWIALELYIPPEVVQMEGHPQMAFRLRRIEAIGNSPEECMRQLKEAGRDPAGFEFTRLKPPFGGLTS